MGRSIICILISIFCLVSTAALAGETPPGSDKAEKEKPGIRTVYVPYRELEKVIAKEGPGVFLPYPEFEKLWKEAHPETPRVVEKPPVDALIAAASYVGTVDNEMARITATFDLEILKEGWVELPVALQLMAITGAKLDGKDAILNAEKTGYRLLLQRGKSETHQLVVDFVVKVDTRPGEMSLRFGCPRVPVSRLELILPETRLDVAIDPTLAATKIEQQGNSTIVRAFIGSADQIAVVWRPEGKRIGAEKSVLFAATDVRCEIREHLLRVDATINYTIALAERDTFRLKLPEGYKLLAVDGKDLEDWTENERDLTVKTFTPQKKAYQLKVRLERSRKAADEVALPAIVCNDARRDQGHIAVFVEGELKVRLDSIENASQLDPEELPNTLRAGGKGRIPPSFAFKYLSHPYAIKLAVEKILPEIEADVYSLTTITERRVTIAANILYAVRKAGIFELKIAIPEGFDVREVGNENSVEGFRIEKEDGRQVVRVALRVKMTGSFWMSLNAERARKEDETKIELPVIRALDVDAEKEKGTVAVAVKSEYSLEAEKKENLQEKNLNEFPRNYVPARLAPGEELARVFKYSRQPISATFNIKRKPTQVYAVVDTLAAVEQDIIRVKSTIRYEINYGAIDEFAFSLPAELENKTDVTAEGFAQKRVVSDGDNSGRVRWELTLPSKRSKSFNVNVSYELKVDKLDPVKATTIDIPYLKVRGTVHSDRGYIAIKRGENLSIVPKATGLEEIDVKELPGRLGEGAFRAFKYVGQEKSDAAPWSLSLMLTSKVYAKVLKTVVLHQHADVTVEKSGQVRGHAYFLIKNKNRQSLMFSFPRDASVLKVYINNTEQRFESRTDKEKDAEKKVYVIDLPKNVAADAQFLIKIDYESAAGGDDLGVAGVFSIFAPEVEGLELNDSYVPVMKLTMRLHLLNEYRYLPFGGNMRHLSGMPRSTWSWLRDLFFPPDTRVPFMAGNLGREIDALVQYAGRAGMPFASRGAGDAYSRHLLLKGEGGGWAKITYMSPKLYYFLDFLFFVAGAFGLFVLGRYTPLSRAGLSVGGFVFAAFLGAALPGVWEDFMNAIFLGVMVVSAIWLVQGIAKSLGTSPATVRIPPSPVYGGAEAPPEPSDGKLEEEPEPEKEEPPKSRGRGRSRKGGE
ncbi:MAG: hypothetical protein ACYS8W_00605 [Planctomycetota bacterium]